MVKFLWLHSEGQRGCIVIRLILGVVQVLLGLSVVWISKRFIDTAVVGGELLSLVSILLFLIILSIICRQYIGFIDTMTSTKLTRSFRQQLLSHILMRKVYDGNPHLHTGDYTSRLMQDIPAITKTISHTIPQAITTGIQLIGAFWLMHLLNPRLAWLLLLGTPVLAVLGKAFGMRLRKMTRRIREQEAMIQGKSQEWIENTITMQALRCLDTLAGIMADLQQTLVCQVEKRARLTVFGRSVVSVCFGLSYMGVFVWGGYQLRNGAITFGLMTAFLQLVNQIRHPIMALMNTVPELFQTAASIDRLCEIEKMTVETDVRGEITMPFPLTFRNIAFKYPGNEDFEIRLSYTFIPGTTTAIVGESGKGKTTILRLMFGLLKPTQGEILLGDELFRVSMRGNFVYIPQGNTLMHGTIRDNLLLGKPDASDSELWYALHTAVADFVNDLDTMCHEKGDGLSEGMAQRIAIARGLLQPGWIMLFDEVTSALDAESERELFKRLTARYPKRTMIFVTHSKNIARMCQYQIKLID